MKYPFTFTVLFLVVLEVHGQKIQTGFVADRWSGKEINFPINTSYNELQIKKNHSHNHHFYYFSLPLEFYSTKEVFFDSQKNLKLGKPELYSIPKLEGEGEFTRVAFDDTLFFIKTKFLEKVNFSLAKFKNKASFFSSEFYKSTFFWGTEFKDYADFLNTKFYETTNFDGAQFWGTADFSRCVFKNNVSFGTVPAQLISEYNLPKINFLAFTEIKYQEIFSVKFHNGAIFENTDFGGAVFFNSASFLNPTTFSFAVFRNKLIFTECNFKSNVTFFRTQLPETVVLNSVSFDPAIPDILLNRASVDSLRKRFKDTFKRCKIYLKNIDCSKIILDAAKFELAFDSTIVYDEAVGVYEQVIKKCRDMGYEESVKGFDIDLQKMRIKHKKRWYTGIKIWLNEYWWNFGYEPTKIFRNTFFAFAGSFLLIFFFLPKFAKAYFPHQLNMSRDTAVKLKWNSKQNFYTRFKVAFFYTSLVFFGLKMEHIEVKYREYPGKTIVIYIIFVSGIIHLAYLASVILNK